MNDPFAEDLARDRMKAADPFAADLARDEQSQWEASPRYARLKAKHEETMANVEQLKSEPDPWSAGEVAKAVGTNLKDRAVGLGRGVASVAMHPVDTVIDPHRRRELERGVDDAVTLGYARKLGGYVDPAYAATEEEDRRLAPDVREGGQALGILAPSPVKFAGAKAMTVAQKALPGAGKLAAAGRGLLGYEAVAPAAAALHADAGSPGQRLQAFKDTALDPAGQLMAGGAGAGFQGLQNKIKSSRGAQAREFIEREGGGAKVGLTTPGSGGVFKSELEGVAPNDKGIGVAAKKGSQAILKGIKEEHRIETSEPFRALKAQIDNSPAAAQPRDVTPIVQHMQNAAYDLETAPVVRTQLEGELKLLERYRANEDSPVMVPERQLNGLRRSLMRMAKVGQSDVAGEKEAPLRAAALIAKQMVDEGPYAALNELYAKGATKLTSKRRQLGLKAKPPADSNVDVKKVKLSLEREGQNTKTGGGDSDIAGFREQNPGLRTPANLAELQRAKADLSFHLAPQHGGLIERTTGAALGPGVAIMAAAAGHGLPGVGMAAGIAGLQNATPIAGRVLYPLTRPPGVNPIVWAAMQQKDREAKMAAQLRGGGQ